VESQPLSGGTYDSNLSFIQLLTEAAKLVPNAVVLASLPESNSQAGGPRGIAALQALESVFNRVQALWKAVARHSRSFGGVCLSQFAIPTRAT